LSPALIALLLACCNSLGLPVLKAFWNCEIRTGTDLDGFFGLAYLV